MDNLQTLCEKCNVGKSDLAMHANEGQQRVQPRIRAAREFAAEHGRWASQVTSLPPIESLVAKLRAQGITLPPGPVHADGYGDTPELSESLLELIRLGRKRAGTGLLWAYEHDGEHIARVGDIEIAVDHLYEPAIVTRIVSSEVVPFDEVTAEYAAIEGEGDGSLDYWRQAHWAYFCRECRRIGREPAESMPVICCVFEVLDVVPPQSAARLNRCHHTHNRMSRSVPLAELPNLGPKSQAMLALAGITTFAQLRKVGSVAAYVRAKQVGANVSLNLLWALEGLLTGQPWKTVAREQRTRLLLALDDYQRGV